MFDILTLNSISKKIYDVLDDNYAVSDNVASPDAILVRSFNMADYEIGDNLLAVARAGAGVNNIPIPRMTDAGICVFNTPGANANGVKELVIASMLLASRDILGGIGWANSLTGDDVAKQVEKGKSKFAGTEIGGKTVGIVGLGAIGSKVANACASLGMNVVIYDHRPVKEKLDQLHCDYTLVGTPEDVYPLCDYVTLHVPAKDNTKGMINDDTLKLFKDGAILINLARAELADVNAVKRALESGKLRKYVVDFPTPEALNSNGIIAIPHLGASTEESEDNCAVMATSQLKEYLENGNVKNSVNFPALIVPTTKSHRMTIVANASYGVPEAVKEVLDGKIDYELHSAERGTVCYIIIDTDTDLNDDNISPVETISDIENIISIRLL